MENNNYNQNFIVVDIDGEEYLLEDLLESLFLMGGIEIKIDQINSQIDRIKNNNKQKELKF